MTVPKLLVLMLLASAALSANAATIYRWVDDKGKVHYGDVVPDKYKNKASNKADLKDVQPTSDAAQEAQARDAREKARAIFNRKPAADDKANAAENASSGNAQETPCQAQWRKYRESQACFGPYRTATGGIKAEAFQVCTEVPEPARC